MYVYLIVYGCVVHTTQVDLVSGQISWSQDM